MRTTGSTETNPPAERVANLPVTSQDSSARREIGAIFDGISRAAAKRLNADAARIFLLDGEKKELWSILAGGDKQVRFDARLGLAGAAVLTGQAIRVDDARRDPRFFQGTDERTGCPTRTALAFPLRDAQGKIDGVIEVLNKAGGAFTAADEAFLQSMAAKAAPGLEMARMVKELEVRRDRLLEEHAQLWKEVGGRSATQPLVGISGQMQQVVRRIEQISGTDVNVLITGESGTGKEMVARAIHFSSPRAGQPLVSLNCAALPENLIESELFGIEKGVATGVEARAGKFQAANGGTLFLDEIGDLPLTAQAKILRVLQDKLVEPVGGRKSVAVDTRVLAATNKDLEAEIKRRRFREDLYYRLNVIHLHLPALRERREDIPLLADYFLNRFCREMKKEPMKLSAATMRCLEAYSWPGNIRELENEIKRAVITSHSTTVTKEGLSEVLRDRGSADASGKPTARQSLKDQVAELEIRLIREAVAACGHNQQQAARALGLSRQGLIKKMKRYLLK